MQAWLIWSEQKQNKVITILGHLIVTPLHKPFISAEQGSRYFSIASFHSFPHSKNDEWKCTEIRADKAFSDISHFGFYSISVQNWVGYMLFLGFKMRGLQLKRLKGFDQENRAMWRQRWHSELAFRLCLAPFLHPPGSLSDELVQVVKTLHLPTVAWPHWVSN